MKGISIDGGDSDSPDGRASSENAQGDAARDGEGLKGADYCHLAEECFFLAAITNDPEAAAQLLKAADEYLRRADAWLADQLKTS